MLVSKRATRVESSTTGTSCIIGGTCVEEGNIFRMTTELPEVCVLGRL